MEMKCVSDVFKHSGQEMLKMRNSSPNCDPSNTSLLYNDSGYITNLHQESQSLSTNSEPSLTASDDVSLHSRQAECLTAIHTADVYFCENAVFDEPKLEGPPLLCDNSNNYEEFSSLIKFSLENDASSYVTNDVYLTNTKDTTVSEYCDNSTVDRISDKITYETSLATCASKDSTNILQYFDQNSLSSYSSVNASQSICVSELNDHQNIISQAVEECLTVTTSEASSMQEISVRNNFEYFSNKVETQEAVIIEDISTINSNNGNNVRIQQITNTNTSSLNTHLSRTSDTKFEEDASNNSKIENNDGESTISQINNSTPTKTYINPVNSYLSPELFSDDDMSYNDSSFLSESISHTQKGISLNEHSLRNDRKLLKRVQETLSGVPPPPSVTILQITVSDMLNKMQNNRHLFLTDIFCDKTNVTKNVDSEHFLKTKSLVSESKGVKSLLITSSKEETENKIWPDIADCRYHGLYYNRSKVSEDFEHYCAKYAGRYVGAETASSCTVWSMFAPNSATKRRNSRLRWGIKSPGKRLSHLARRRITFSSSNLQQQAGASMSVLGNTSSAKQLLIDARKSTSYNKRKSPKKSPWRKSPKRSPHKRIKTPSSSAKKRAARRITLGFDDEPKPSTSKVSTTKRALFQSPEHTRSTISTSDSSQFLQKNKPKRALFLSPTKSSPSKTNCDKKRKRLDEECYPNKFPRSLSFDTHHSKALHAAAGGSPLVRRHSEVPRSNISKGELSDLHRKKLLWAVSEALRSQHVGMSHPQFRTFAPILCKIVKHLMPDLTSNGQRQPGSTSERMLKIAHQHAYSVTRGKSFDEIMQQIKETKANLKNLKPPTGYIALELVKNNNTQAKNVLQDKSMNIEINSNKKLTKSPTESRFESKVDENNKLRIRRQIVFDDGEITKTYNTNR